MDEKPDIWLVNPKRRTKTHHLKLTMKFQTWKSCSEAMDYVSDDFTNTAIGSNHLPFRCSPSLYNPPLPSYSQPKSAPKSLISQWPLWMRSIVRFCLEMKRRTPNGDLGFLLTTMLSTSSSKKSGLM